MFHLTYKSNSKNTWYYTPGHSFSHLKKNARNYDSLDQAMKSYKSERKEHPTIFSNKPADRIKVVDEETGKIFSTDATPKATLLCLGKRSLNGNDWVFLLSNGKWGSFNSSNLSEFDDLSVVREKAEELRGGTKTVMAIFDTKTRRMIEDLGTTKLPSAIMANDMPSMDDVQQALKVILELINSRDKLEKKLNYLDLSETQDLLHAIELNELTDTEKVELVNMLKDTRQYRRKIKDLYLFANSLFNSINVEQLEKELSDNHIVRLNQRHYHYRSPEVENFVSNLDQNNQN